MKEKEQGITLIALIITIIVMIILVGVTINVAINGGLFSQAQDAAKKQEEQTIYDQIVGMAVWKSDGTINVKETVEAIENSGLFTIKSKNPAQVTDGTTEATITITGKNGEYTYKIRANEITIIGGGDNPPPGNSSDLERYILGESGTGRTLFIEQDANEGIISMSSFAFEQDKTDTSSTVYQDVKWGYGFGEEDFNETTGEVDLYIRYGKEVYKVTIEVDEVEIDGDSEEIYKSKALTYISTPTGHLGEYVTYGGNDYIVMAEDTANGTVDLVSAQALQVNSNDIALGYNDPGAISAVPAADENSVTTEEQAARGRWSYNNSINTLVTACKNATGLTVDGTDVISIRSVGNENVKYTSSGITGNDTSTTYTYPYQTFELESNWYTANNYNNYNMKAEDTNYTSDVTKMKQLGIFAADNFGYYWLASRRIDADANDVGFRVRGVYEIGDLGNGDLCDVYNSGNTYGYDRSYAVRPVVTLNSSLLSFE